MNMIPYLAVSKNLLVCASSLFICALVFLALWYTKAHRTVKLLIGNQMRHLLAGYSSVRSTIRFVLLLCGLLSLFYALLRPQWGEKKDVVAKKSRTVLIALDISKSMLATDCQPNRLLCAKQKIKQLVSSLPGDRCGLILFSGKALVYCPFTDDHEAFESFLDLIDVEVLSSGTTAIDQALTTALDLFVRVSNQSSKLLVLYTDGEDFSQDLSAIATQAHQNSLHIVTVGVGTPFGSPIPILDTKTGKQIGHIKDAHDAVVITRLNEPMLKKLASDLSGIYVPLSSDTSDNKAIVSYIQKFEREQTAEKTVTNLQDQYPLFTLISFVCLLVAWII